MRCSCWPAPTRCRAWPATATRPPGRWPASTRAPRRCCAHAHARGAGDAGRARRGGETLADYRATGLTLGTHPLALLRAQLAAFKVLPAAVLAGYPTGRLARASGLVTHRQRPETAKGVVFVTLEDETGAVNVIVWPDVVDKQRKPLLAATLLTVYGVWQREGGVRHLIARQLVDHTALLQGLDARSRNFR